MSSRTVASRNVSDHPPQIIERHCDVAVVGGSAAGLAAALQLGRQRRSAIVIDDGTPRNAPATHMHGYLGYEGRSPAELVATGREEVRRYGGEVLTGRATQVTRTDGGLFRVELVGGNAIVARRVLAATGLIDDLPDIEGLAELWGSDVIHCPFCHGYEVRDERIVMIVFHPRGLHPAGLFRQLSSRLTVVLHDPADVDPTELNTLRASGATVVDARVNRIVTAGTGRLTGVELVDGAIIDADAVAVSPRFRVRAEPFLAVGLRPTAHPMGLGDFVETDATGETSVPGLYAAGNVTDPSQQVLQAAANGSRVGAMLSFSLAREDLETREHASANAADWDRRYEADQMWSGHPNSTLVQEINGLPTGRALDVGAGEGGDALWLAEQGWNVTANDISQRALDRVAAEADTRGLVVDCLRADANGRDPFPPAVFDLVSAQYASIPRTPDDRAVHNLLDAVAPGGTLLVVSHDLDQMRAVIDDPTHQRPFDPDAYVRVDDFVRGLADEPDVWDIEVHGSRERRSAAEHRIDDIVLRARRRGA